MMVLSKSVHFLYLIFFFVIIFTFFPLMSDCEPFWFWVTNHTVIYSATTRITSFGSTVLSVFREIKKLTTNDYGLLYRPCLFQTRSQIQLLPPHVYAFPISRQAGIWSLDKQPFCLEEEKVEEVNRKLDMNVSNPPPPPFSYILAELGINWTRMVADNLLSQWCCDW